MAMALRFVRNVCVMLALLNFSIAGAQVLPLMNEFSGMRFNGTVQVSWPVLYRNCTFRTDSILLSRSYGAVLVGCTIECSNPTLYLTQTGSGVIMQGCSVSGCQQIMPSVNMSSSDRIYISDLILNGHECSAQDDQEHVIDIDGLELAESVRTIASGQKTDRPLFMVMTAGTGVLRYGESTVLSVRGLSDDMFIGWHSPDSLLALKVLDDPFMCSVSLKHPVTESHSAIVEAYTEYGLEASVNIEIVTQ